MEKRQRESEDDRNDHHRRHRHHHKKQKESIPSDQCVKESIPSGQYAPEEFIPNDQCAKESIPNDQGTPEESIPNDQGAKKELIIDDQCSQNFSNDESLEEETKIPPSSNEEDKNPPVSLTELCELIPDSSSKEDEEEEVITTKSDSEYHEDSEEESEKKLSSSCYGDPSWKAVFFGDIEHEYPSTRMRHVCCECAVIKMSKDWFYPLDKSGVYCFRCAHGKYGLNPDTEYTQGLWKKYAEQYYH